MKEKGTVKPRGGNIKEAQGLVNDSSITMNSPLVLLFHTWCLYITTLDMQHFPLLVFFSGSHTRHLSLDVLSLCFFHYVVS